MCDTFVSIVPDKKSQSVFFAKNSDREPNEAQVLEYCPGQEYSIKDKVHCTYISIPQVKETVGTILCRPFWMWGAEMGANEKGVTIGNEAVFTKMPYNTSSGLTGMDMLRLALERSHTAEQALDVIVGLLSDYGQGGICGYNNKKMIYHSSFIIADPTQAWVLETAGDLWAALKVKDKYSISNALTIGSEFDECHADTYNIAREKGWLKSGKEFHFANCFSDWLYTTFSASSQRKSCSFSLISEHLNEPDIASVFKILRHHTKEPYSPSAHLLQDSICAHAGNGITRDSNTNGSLVAHLKEDKHIYWATGTAAPCTSLFKPIWFNDQVLPDLGPLPKGHFNSKSFWWNHERIHRSVLHDFSLFEPYREERDRQEATFIKYAYRTGPKESFNFTSEAFETSRTLTKKWLQEIQNKNKNNSPYNFLYRRYWKQQNQKARLEF
ncbi:C69 family dipeptidase [bacterium]|nr:C69 family dipeptidase [bacterium]